MQTLKDVKNTFGARLRGERERLGHTQEEFGTGGGVTRLTQSKYEKGESSPNVEYLMAIDAMGADFNYLLTGEKHSYKSGEDAHNEHASLASLVVEELEKAIKAKGVIFSPRKKAQLAATIYKHSRLNSPVDKSLVSDLLNLASE